MKLVHFTLPFLVTVATIVSVKLNEPLLSADVEWPLFKEKFNRVYESPAEEERRKEIFSMNVDKINAHNTKYNNGESTFAIGINQFSDMTNTEVIEKIECVPEGPLDEDSQHPDIFGPYYNLPEEVDWRNKRVVTRVKYQDDCKSCWAFSTTGVLEGQRALKTKELVELSEQELIECSRPQGNYGCAGGTVKNSYKYVLHNDGISTEKDYPYIANDTFKCHSPGKDPYFKWKSYHYVQFRNETALQGAVAKVGPISVFICTTELFRSYTKGIFKDPTCDPNKLGHFHSVLIVGYGSADSVPYWIVKNSWSEQWGYRGYMLMERNQNVCGVADSASYMTGDIRK